MVLVKKLPPAGPVSVPIDCNKRQAIAPGFGQLGSEPAGIDCSVCPHTLLVSNELCHVAFPKGSGFGADWLGLVSGLRKCVITSTYLPKTFTKRVASGREALTVQEAVEAPALVGRQT